MDLLLTHGYFLSLDPHEQKVMRPYPPLGILYISSHLKTRGFDVSIFDSTFSDPEAFEAFLRTHQPTIVGIYSNMMTRRNIIPMIRMCKQLGCTVVIGGPDPANYPENYLAHGADFVIFGEGELTLEALLPLLSKPHTQHELEKIAGIAFLADDATFVQTPAREQIKDLNAQPFPDREAIDLPAYMQVWKKHHGQSAVSLITARGCPYKCNWCSHAVFGYSHRRRSPQNVVEEVDRIRHTYNPDLLWYADDVFTMNHRWLFEYAEKLGERGLKLPFETISREDRLNEQVVKTLADMGCYRLWIGAESGSQRILDRMERQTDVKRVVEMVRLLKRYDIQTGMFIMLGYDGEEESDIAATVQVLKDASPDIFLTTVAYPIAGTRYFDAVSANITPLRAWAEGSDSDYTVIGRRSHRYYQHATRWMVGELELHRQRTAPAKDIKRLTKAFLNAQAGKLGMRLTRHQIEDGHRS